MPYRDADETALARSEREIQAREDLAERARVGRERALALRETPLPLRRGRKALNRGLSLATSASTALAALWWMFAAQCSLYGMLPSDQLTAYVLALGFTALAWGLSARARARRRRRIEAAEAWAAGQPFPVSGFFRLVIESWNEVRITVAFEHELDEDLAAMVPDLARQLDDDALVEAVDGELVIRRLPASHRTAEEWAQDLVDQVLRPLHLVTPIREVSLAEDARPRFAPPRSLRRK